MTSNVSRPLLAFANLLVPIAILVFATGFFPHKPFVPGKARFEEHNAGRPREDAPFNRVIFMVVDALRSDFLYGPESGFQYTQSLIRSGAGIPFTAHATSPTITMPRVKAITTGSIPSFLDVILNFAESDTTSSLANQDTWLSQLKDMPGGKLTMFGDDTWLKLFPDTFARADGTTSFFVSDFTEVDNNVTRNIAPELDRNDWNGMIMHYLGLDHIGHKTGPRGPNMIPKQVEMDGIVRQIFEMIESTKHLQSTLMVLAGDHGMNDAGNHGGSAVGETSPALLFLSPKLKAISSGYPCPLYLLDGSFDYYSTVEQSDIAPTLAALLGFPVPLNNLGVLISTFLPLWGNNYAFRLMEENARQILGIVQGTFPGLNFDATVIPSYCSAPKSDGEVLSCLWFDATRGRRGRDLVIGDQSLIALKEFCKYAQEYMSSTASNYDLRSLYVGIGIALIGFICSLSAATMSFAQGDAIGIWITLVVTSYGAMMFASSFVEEEQHFWYWATSIWFAWTTLKRGRSTESNIFVQMCCAAALQITLRILRRWNQTGQKHAGESDVAKTFFPAHKYLLWTLVILTYLDIVQRISRRASPLASRLVSTAAAAALGVAAIGFKIAFTKADAPELLNGIEMISIGPMMSASLILQARVVFWSCLALLISNIGPNVAENLFSAKTAQNVLLPCHDILSLFLITQTRTTNIPAFLLFQIQYHSLAYLKLPGVELSLTSLLLQYVSFFALGGSNAISSIDLSNAYNGVAGYNVGAVAVLTFLSNWAGPVWWTSATVLLLTAQKTQTPPSQSGSVPSASHCGHVSRPFDHYISILTFFTSSSVLAVMIACTMLRTHLFIWTVFSPKYLYIMAWSMGQHLFINIGFGSLLAWMAP